MAGSEVQGAMSCQQHGQLKAWQAYEFIANQHHHMIIPIITIMIIL